MALQTLQETLLTTSQELLLLGVISTVNTEADVHAAANALVGNDLVHLRVLVQGTVDQIGLLLCDLFLSTNLLGTKLAHKISHNLAGDPEVEDGQSVVKGVVLGDSSVVQHHWAGQTTNVKTVQQASGGSGSVRREQVLANDGEGDTSNTNVLLRTALEILVSQEEAIRMF